MKLPLLAVLAVLASAPARAADACAPHAGLLKIAYKLGYERHDGPSRLASLDRSECTLFVRDAGVADFDESRAGTPSEPEPRLRWWSETSPYEVVVEFSAGWAYVSLMKRDGPYSRLMARIDRLEPEQLAATTLDYDGDVTDGEQPELRVSAGVRRISRAARVTLTPLKR